MKQFLIVTIAAYALLIATYTIGPLIAGALWWSFGSGGPPL